MIADHIEIQCNCFIPAGQLHFNQKWQKTKVQNIIYSVEEIPPLKSSHIKYKYTHPRGWGKERSTVY